MPNLNTCRLKFEFEFGLIDGRSMQTTVMHNNTANLVVPGADNFGSVEFDVDLPTQVVLKFTGKNQNTDTLVDKNGNIVGDMYVKVVSVSIDGFKLKEIFLYQRMKLVTDNAQEITTSYVGFNGSITIDLSECNVFSQYFSMQT